MCECGWLLWQILISAEIWLNEPTNRLRGHDKDVLRWEGTIFPTILRPLSIVVRGGRGWNAHPRVCHNSGGLNRDNMQKLIVLAPGGGKGMFMSGRRFNDKIGMKKRKQLEKLPTTKGQMEIVESSGQSSLGTWAKYANKSGLLRAAAGASSFMLWFGRGVGLFFSVVLFSFLVLSSCRNFECNGRVYG